MIFFTKKLTNREFCGLTLSDIDFRKHEINVDHQLLRASDMRYYIEKPKTDSGKRKLPMTAEVEASFRRIVESREKPKVEPMIDGYVGFLYMDKNGMPMVAMHWEKYFEHIVAKYNSIYKVEMPAVTPHICRHTYCTNMAKLGINPKTLQYLMGHSDIAVTMNTYTHFGVDEAKAEMERLEREKNARDEVFRVSDEFTPIFTPNDRKNTEKYGKLRKETYECSKKIARLRSAEKPENTGKSRILQRFKRYDKNIVYLPRFDLQITDGEICYEGFGEKSRTGR